MAIYHVSGGGDSLQNLISLSSVVNYDTIVVGDGNYSPISSTKILYIRSENGPTKTGIRTKLSTVVALPKQSRISGFYLDKTVGSGGYYDTETDIYYISCYLYNCHIYHPSRAPNYSGFIHSTIIENCQVFGSTTNWTGTASTTIYDCSCYNCRFTDINIKGDYSITGGGSLTKSIFYNCTFANIIGRNGWYSLIGLGNYYNCIFSNISNNYRLSAANVKFYKCSLDETTLTDARNGNNMSTILSASFNNCYLGDPIFRDATAQDYTLKKASPIKNFGSPSYLKTTYDFANKLWNTEHPSIGCYQFYELPWHWIPNYINPIGYRKIVNHSIPYVTDGLIVWFDGKWNLGVGKWNDNSRKWINLAKEVTGSSYTPELILTDHGIFFGDMLSSDGLGLAAYGTSIPSIWPNHVEVVLGKHLTTGSPNKVHFKASVRNSTVALSSTNSEMQLIVRYRVVYGYRGSPFNPTDPPTLNSFMHISTVRGSTSRACVNYFNNQQWAGDYQTATFAAQSQFVVGANEDGTESAQVNIKCIRIYNRVLTDEERIHNYNVDVKRFNL